MMGAFLAGCAVQSAPQSDLEQESQVCGTGQTVEGIDVSYYQGTIDWNAVKAGGVVYAFIRVSDGLNTKDPKFATYWADSRTAGVYHGAYQYFEPSQDAIMQADLLLSTMGTMQSDDLPPVIDVETAGGLSATQLASKVQQWVSHVGAAIGRPPIIYTGGPFWDSSVGGANMTTSPLWHAQYTTAACPTIADPWTTWAFWQYTDSGTISGISGSMDVDRWNGDLASLQAFLGTGSGGASCGDGTCQATETKISCPQDCGPCLMLDPSGGEVDDSSECFTAGGPTTGMRHATDAGEDGELYWTHTTSNATEDNFGQWDFFFSEAGHYKLEVSTPAKYAQSKMAKYVVHTAGGDMDDTIDQTAVDGWQTVGEYDFAAGGQQWIHLADNTGEPNASNVQLVFDAIRLTRLDGSGSGSGSGDGSGSGSGDGSGVGVFSHHVGCSAGGNGSLWVLLALLGVRRRRSSGHRELRGASHSS